MTTSKICNDPPPVFVFCSRLMSPLSLLVCWLFYAQRYLLPVKSLARSQSHVDGGGDRDDDKQQEQRRSWRSDSFAALLLASTALFVALMPTGHTSCSRCGLVGPVVFELIITAWCSCRS
jgi:hypothetical protein